MNEAINFVKQGGTIAEASRMFGYNYIEVWEACNRAGVSSPKMKISTYEILADLINTSQTQTEIAEKYHISRQRVSEIAINARQAGIKLR